MEDVRTQELWTLKTSVIVIQMKLQPVLILARADLSVVFAHD